MKITKKEDLSSEDIVADFLTEKGYLVSISQSESSNGFDLVAIKNGDHILVEVKSAIASKSRSGFKINKVQKLAESCSYIAVVTPAKNVFFLDMAVHLKTYKGKSRGVTKLVRLYDSF